MEFAYGEPEEWKKKKKKVRKNDILKKTLFSDGNIERSHVPSFLDKD